jgi:GH25 family lysozyme M1 (1,4-beta-N-acetylmuramidase)
VRLPLTAVRRSARSLVVLVTAASALAATAFAYADGIDISHWQGTVNWGKVKSDDVTFAFMKATEGTAYADPTLRTNWAGAEKVGIYRAAYHFARPSTASGSADAQARFFVSQAGTFQDKGDLPPVLDLEATGGLGPAALRSWVSTWLTTVERLTKRTPVLYFSPYFWIDHLGNSTAFTRYPLWIAHYTQGAPLVPGGWKTWTFWQRTSSGHVAGIGGLVDMNRFNGSSAQLSVLANTTGGSGNPPPGGPTVPVGAPTRLTMTPATTRPAIGQHVTFGGDLRTTTPAAAAPDQTVSLWARSVGAAAWSKVAAGSTDHAGHYRLDARVLRPAAYQTRSADSKVYAPSVSAPVHVSTPARSTVAIDLRQDRTVVHPGAALVLYGHLRSGSTGLGARPVRYYKRSPSGGPWIYVGISHSVSPTGWHSLTVHPMVDRVWKAVFAGGDFVAPATSGYLTVQVR